MKVMFVSDIHGSLRDTEVMIDTFLKESADRLVLLGDLLYHGPRNPLPETYNPSEVANLLNKYSEKIIAVKGNCDSEVDQMILDFEIMQPHSHLLIDQHHFFLTHGHKYGPNKFPSIGKGTILVSGHTHVLMLERKDNIIVLNPGSIALPKEKNPKTYAIHEDNLITIKTFDDKIISSMKLK